MYITGYTSKRGRVYGLSGGPDLVAQRVSKGVAGVPKIANGAPKDPEITNFSARCFDPVRFHGCCRLFDLYKAFDYGDIDTHSLCLT